MFRSEPIDPNRERKFQVYFSDWTTWWNYFQTYADVFEATVARVEGGEQFNHQALPALFLMRHTLELGLKAQILKFQSVNKEDEIPVLQFNAGSHKISVLLSKFENHVSISLKKVKVDNDVKLKIREYHRKFRSLQALIEEFDNNSQAFRYPVQNDGAPYWSRDHDSNVSGMINIYFDIKPFLIFTDTVFSEYGLFAEVDYEAYMQSLYDGLAY